jgi:hypothetical protein
VCLSELPRLYCAELLEHGFVYSTVRLLLHLLILRLCGTLQPIAMARPTTGQRARETTHSSEKTSLPAIIEIDDIEDVQRVDMPAPKPLTFEYILAGNQNLLQSLMLSIGL